MGTVMEIGVRKPYRKAGLGRTIVAYVEGKLQSRGITRCYVSAYGPAQGFWERCGYGFNGATAKNGLPVMTKDIGACNGNYPDNGK